MKVKSIAANQTEITLANGTIVFVSYETPVAAFIPGRGIVRSEQYYSRTTSKHVNQFIQRTNPASTQTFESQEFLDTLIG